jgi:hypothetical protein
VRKIGFVILISALWFAVGCGGSSSSSTIVNTGGSGTGGTGTTTTSTPPTTTTVLSTPGSNQTIASLTSGNNVAPLIVDAGPVPNTNPQANVAYTTVTVCIPNTTNCVTIPNVAVDTGSTGLRIPTSLLTTLALPNVSSSATIAECIQFLDNSYFWGSVKMADVKMGGTGNNGTSSNSELASSVPIQVMGDASVPSAPKSCSTFTTFSGAQKTGTVENTVQELGANGLIGVGNFQYDCDVPGEATGVGSNTFGIGSSNMCSPTGGNTTPIPGSYYTCSSSSCTEALVPGPQQVRNPVSMFAKDNNGVILELPVVPVGGQADVSLGQGALVFGIGTQLNNGLSSSAFVLPLDTNYADDAWLGITTNFNNAYYPPLGIYTSTGYNGYGSFLDSGSNGIYFLDSPTSGITDCPGNNDAFYCPSSTESLTAYNVATGGSVSSEVMFNVSNADTLFSTNGTAFSDLAGPNSTGTNLTSSNKAADGYFDWGLPFFYGRNVYTAIWGITPPSGVPAGPFWAY